MVKISCRRSALGAWSGFTDPAIGSSKAPVWSEFTHLWIQRWTIDEWRKMCLTVKEFERPLNKV